MRELPFMQISKNLEHQQNVGIISDQIRRIRSVNSNFAAKPINRMGFKVDITNLKPTACYEGDGYYQQRQGQVTFKHKKEKKKQKGSEESANTAQQPGSNMLRHDEIQHICEKHNLSRGQVYQIRSNFSSMCTMSASWLEAA